jgi:predicted O-linked N-acetylglucosamine transferase (SPINDLY family)
VNSALLKANSHFKKSEFEEARKLYQVILEKYPHNKRAQQGLANLQNKKQSYTTEVLPQSAIDQLIKLYNQGQFVEVVEQAQAITVKYPGSYLVWNILGAASKAMGRVHVATEAFKKVTELNPTYGTGFNNLGVMLEHQGKLDEAIHAYTKALGIEPENAEVYFNIGNALKEQGKLDEAIDSYAKALAIKPENAEVYFNIGNALKEQDKLDEAIEVYEKAISLKPDHALAHNNMGNALKEQGKLDEAIEAYTNALSIKPDHVDAHNNMGNALRKQGKLDKAIGAYTKALSIKPDHADAYNNMGNALEGQGKLDEAIEAYTDALSIKPEQSMAYYNIGDALLRQSKLDEAIDAFEKALSIEPNHAIARSKRLHCLALVCDWSSLDIEQPRFEELGIVEDSVQPFTMIPLEDAPERHRLRSELYAIETYPNRALTLPAMPRGKSTRLRIGYFSADFTEHPVGYLIAKVLELHNRDKFEIFGYCLNGNSQTELRQRLINSFDYFADLNGLSDKDAALMARQDRLDIAIDLTGYTSGNRSGIFAYRAAPIQINYLGFPGTSGADYMDYIIADHFLIPDESQHFYTEKPIYLPHTYMPTDNTRKFSTNSIDRGSLGLPENAFIICCFNNNYKITSSEFNIWMRVLNKVENSILWIRSSNYWSEENIKKEADKRGIDPNRIVFAGMVPMDEHLTRQRFADLFVDTFNYNAHTTATEALWAGLPVVTKSGQGFAARVAGSLLNAVGLPELITDSENEYEALILNLATDKERLSRIKKKLAVNRLSEPLFDTEKYTIHLEAGYQKAHRRYFLGKHLDTISVSE